MSDYGDMCHEMKDRSQKKRSDNYQKSIEILKEHNIEFKMFDNRSHLRVGDFDYWPSTGLFIHIKTKQRGRGVFNLIKRVKK